MSDLYKNTNIRKYDKNDPRYLKVFESEIIHKRDEKSKSFIPYEGKSIKKNKLLYARIMQILLKKFSSPNSENISHLSAGEQEFYSLLSSFSKKLLTLSKTDKSKNIEFINSLSSNWDVLSLSIKRRKHLKSPPSYLKLLDEVINDIEIHGSNDGASFGYYLIEHKNTNWFPLPYLNMLKALYDDHIENGKKSILSSWQNTIWRLLVLIAATK